MIRCNCRRSLRTGLDRSLRLGCLVVDALVRGWGSVARRVAIGTSLRCPRPLGVRVFGVVRVVLRVRLLSSVFLAVGVASRPWGTGCGARDEIASLSVSDGVSSDACAEVPSVEVALGAMGDTSLVVARSLAFSTLA